MTDRARELASLRDLEAEIARLRAEAGRRRERLGLPAALASEADQTVAIVQSASEHAIVATDLDGRITAWNSGAAGNLGWSEAEALGRDAGGLFFTPEDQAAGQPEHEMRLARTEGHAIDERWHMRKDGRFFAQGEMTPLLDRQGAHIGYVKVFRDRTAQRLAEDLAKAAADELRQLTDALPLLVGSVGPDHRYRFVNRQYEAWFGIPRERLIGLHIRDVFGEDMHRACVAHMERALGGDVAECEIVLPDRAGGQRTFHVVFLPRRTNGGVDGFYIQAMDITARKITEAQLALKDERLQMALTSSGAVGLWDWMVDTDLLHGDANFARLYGLDIARTVSGLTMEEYQEHVIPEDIAPLRERIRAVFEHGADFLVEYRLAVPGQPLRWVECKGRMIADAKGRPYRFSGTAVDITARKTAEEQKHLLMEELSHRVKNTFAMVQAIVTRTLRGADPARSETLQNRLAALGRAHDVLLQRSWVATKIADLVETVLRTDAEGGRFALSGPNFDVNGAAALSLSLLLHELATNATKYGALSNDTGRVHVSWRSDGDRFRLCWEEQGGPPARAPSRQGLGSKLIAMGIRGSRNVALTHTEAGLQAIFEADLHLVTAEAQP